MLLRGIPMVYEGYHLADMTLAIRNKPAATIDGIAKSNFKAGYAGFSASLRVLGPANHFPVTRTALIGENLETSDAALIHEPETAQPAAPIARAKPTKPMRKTVRFAIPALKTSDQLTFIRHTTSPMSGSKEDSISPHPQLHGRSMFPLRSPRANELPQPTGLRHAFEAYDVPSNLDEFEVIGSFLAKTLGMEPGPSYLD
jgi:hypothetical protein